MICTFLMGLAGAGLADNAYVVGLPRSGLASTLPTGGLLPPAPAPAASISCVHTHTKQLGLLQQE